MSSLVSLDTIVALCKRRGFVYQSAEIYGGLNGVYDFGPLGTLMNQNIRRVWRASLENEYGEIVDLEGSLLAPRGVWEASGHIENFNDPMVDCLHCNHRYRADELDLEKGCPHCGQKKWSDVRQFNMMFKTYLGALADQSSEAYLRPETAQSIFVNFKNVTSTTRVKMPFGIAQMGKAFRNEITPKQFLFRVREFEQMELEWFCYADQANAMFDFWREKRLAFFQMIGMSSENIRFHDHGKDELAHYSTACTDVEYRFPFGWKELEGIAHRGSFDLTQHSTHSGKDLSSYDEERKTSEMPTVIESSIGVGRLFLALLCDAYKEDSIDGETRVVLALHPKIAPIKAAFLPLSKKLSDAMKTVYDTIRKNTGYHVQFDETGSIGKRYRRQDEIGTPLCITYDFESEQDNSVTVRHRDSTHQERVAIDQLERYMRDFLQ